MNPQQEAFATSAVKPLVLIGNPGCGKTYSIIQYCIHKAEQGIVTGAEDFLILTFSKSAQLDFLKKGKKSTKSKLFTDKNVRTIHSLAQKIARSHGIVVSNQCVLAAAYDVVLELYEEEIKEDGLSPRSAPCVSSYRFIVVDEAQDLTRSHVRLVYKLAALIGAPVIMVGDPNQTIYQSLQGSSERFLLQHEGTRHYLTTNYRSQAAIVRFLNQHRPNTVSPEMVAVAESPEVGDVPEVMFEELDVVMADIVRKIETSAWPREDIAIIGPVKKSHVQGIKYFTIGLQTVCNTLHKRGIKFVKYFCDTSDDANPQTKPRKGYVNVLTAHSSKGLEFKQCLVLSYHFTTMGRRLPSEESFHHYKCLWYVALSRAKHELAVYGLPLDGNTKPFPLFFDVDPAHFKWTGRVYEKPTYAYLPDPDITPCIVTELLRNQKYFNADVIYSFTKMFPYTVTSEKMYDVPDDEELSLPMDHQLYGALYGLFFELLFEYYHLSREPHGIERFIARHIERVRITVMVNERHAKPIYKMVKDGIISYNIPIALASLPHLEESQRKILEKYEGKLILPYRVEVVWDSSYILERLESLANAARGSSEAERLLWDIVRYRYQHVNHTKYFLDKSFWDADAAFDSTVPYFAHLQQYSISIEPLQFQGVELHDVLTLMGVYDCRTIQTSQAPALYELKFSNAGGAGGDEVVELWVLQLLMYYTFISPSWEPMALRIFNMRSGALHTICIERSHAALFDVFLREVLHRSFDCSALFIEH
jgi:hypothetical protein